MRMGALCVVLVGCSFEAPLGTPHTPGVVVDGSVEIDATPPPPPPPDAAPPPPDAFVKICPPAYVTVAAAQTTSKYRRVQVQRLWQTAKNDCESDGGHLVIPETTAEATAIYTFVNPLLSSPYYWAGVSDPELDDTWVTVTGQPFPIADMSWGTNQPNQNAGEIHLLVGSGAKLYDWYDDGTQEYACECTPSP